jgi:hypothetical protein
MFPCLCVSSAVILLASVAQAAPANPSPVGDWYSEGKQNGERILSLTHYKTDGTFVTEFRECLPNWTGVHTKSGHWSLAGNRLLTTTELAKGRSVSFTGEFEIVSNDGHIWLSHTVGGDALRIFGDNGIRVVRVTPGSRLPSCDQVS